MKAYRLIVEGSNLAASPLYFLDRADASRYQKILLWPWQNLGYFQPQEGEKIPLSQLQLRVEVASLPGIHADELDWILWRVQNTLGFVPLVPGRCFDPSAWRAILEQDLKDPILAPKIAHAERQLDAQAN